MYKSYNQLGAQQKMSEDFKVYELSDREEKMSLINTHPIVCVNVGATWCQPCTMIYSSYATMAKKYNSNTCLLLKEDISKGLTPSASALPLFQFFKNGILVGEIIGAKLGEVENMIEKLIASVEGDVRMNNGMQKQSDQTASGPSIAGQYGINTVRKGSFNTEPTAHSSSYPTNGGGATRVAPPQQLTYGGIPNSAERSAPTYGKLL